MIWGDAATAVFHEATMSPPMGGGGPALHTTSHAASHAASLALSRRLVRGGLSLDPASDWLWAAAGAVEAADPAAREYCWSRALQLNPRRAGTWAALGRMYAQAGAGAEGTSGICLTET